MDVVSPIVKNDTEAFFRLVKHPLKFRLFLLTNLPAAWFSGVRVKDASETEARVSIPYKWFTRNPFRSTYFACLSMAAEMSTGLLAMAHLHKRNPPVSMLVTAVNGSFHKKATGPVTFVCNEGERIREVIETAVATGAPQTIEVVSNGYNEQGELAAIFTITWSFKVKQKRK